MKSKNILYIYNYIYWLDGRILLYFFYGNKNHLVGDHSEGAYYDYNLISAYGSSSFGSLILTLSGT